MSGAVRIDSAATESAISGLEVAQGLISACRGSGPAEVDAGDVSGATVSALLKVIGYMDEISSGIDGFSNKLRGTVEGLLATDQQVSDGVQVLMWGKEQTMAIKTKVEGKPEQITGLADWLASSLKPAISAPGDKFSSTRTALGSEWQDETTETIVSQSASAVGASDFLSTRITDVATALTTYALILFSVKTEAGRVRSDAMAGGLVVSSTVV